MFSIGKVGGNLERTLMGKKSCSLKSIALDFDLGNAAEGGSRYSLCINSVAV